jgi:hypothetical protein
MRPNTPHFEFPSRQNPGPGIENLDSVDACRELPHKVADRGIDQKVDQSCERVGIDKPSVLVIFMLMNSSNL